MVLGLQLLGLGLHVLQLCHFGLQLLKLLLLLVGVGVGLVVAFLGLAELLLQCHHVPLPARQHLLVLCDVCLLLSQHLLHLVPLRTLLQLVSQLSRNALLLVERPHQLLDLAGVLLALPELLALLLHLLQHVLQLKVLLVQHLHPLLVAVQLALLA